MDEVIVQTIKKEYNDRVKAGIAYYKFITSINNIKVATKELQLLAFINYRGTISSQSARKEFCILFDSSEGTISNMVSRLSKINLLVKEKSKTKIHPALRIDFSKNLVLKFFLNVKEKDGDKK